MVQSIKQKPQPTVVRPGLPDFRNLGVLLRILLLVNLMGLLTVLIAEPDFSRLVAAIVEMAGRLELPLFMAVLVLYLLQPVLREWNPLAGAAGIGAVVVGVAFLVGWWLGHGDAEQLVREAAWAIGAAALTLVYFDWRARRFSPALAEARLLALTARIRPHFLFNALNGVLGVIRSDPQRAERALEELADLFRALIRDNRELVPLSDELALCERYIDIEGLRLGERLVVEWATADAPHDALVPPLLLQPLLENAVYYGVEPAAEVAPVKVGVSSSGGQLRIEVENRVVDAHSHHAGNHMALDNIRERLMLFYDLEARLEVGAEGGRYHVVITLPVKRRS